MAGDEPQYRRILLVRHGHYDRSGDLGDTVWGLSPLGRRQAVRAGKRLARLVQAAAGRFEGAYASAWPRATQTAEIAGHELDLDSVKIKPYLHEIVPLVDPDRDEFKLFPLGLPATGTEAREAAHQQIERVRGRFFKVPRRSSVAVIFTHGNLIRYLVTRTLGLPYEAWAMMDIAHTGITEVRIYDGGLEALISYNETGHLPPSMITSA